jgi:pimeloyl-ACP methyl ester carboxylesterase
MIPERQPKTVRVNGADLAYLAQGTGAGLVFVHGGLSDLRSWAFQIEPLSRQFRVVAYSRRYHYPNPGAAQAAEYLATEHRDDLAGLIRALGLAPAHVVGSSYGAYLALLLATAEPDLVRSLVLGEPAALALLGPAGLSDQMDRAVDPARRAFDRGEPEEAVRAFIDGVTGPGAFDHLPPPARAMLLDNVPEFRLEVRTRLERYFSTFGCPDAARIKQPTLLLTGEISPPFLHQITDSLQRCLPNSERAMIPHASHAMHNMNPPAYNETVLAFLGRQH